jgi:hypothetical protein
LVLREFLELKVERDQEAKKVRLEKEGKKGVREIKGLLV